MAAARETPERAAVRRYLESVRAGKFDRSIRLVQETGERDLAVNERLARFCVRAGEEALVVLRDWYAPDGISMEAVLTVMGEGWQKDNKDMTHRSAAMAVECMQELQAGRAGEVEEKLKGLDPDELGEVAMALAVLALEHTMALEEQERLAHWRMTPTVL